jgi:hypothetical protein
LLGARAGIELGFEGRWLMRCLGWLDRQRMMGSLFASLPRNKAKVLFGGVRGMDPGEWGYVATGGSTKNGRCRNGAVVRGRWKGVSKTSLACATFIVFRVRADEWIRCPSTDPWLLNFGGHCSTDMMTLKPESQLRHWDSTARCCPAKMSGPG